MSTAASPVYVFQRFSPNPVFHLSGWQDPRADQEHWNSGQGFEEATTVCGRVSYRYEWEGKERGRETTPSHNVMRWDHANKIGRMCEQCAGIYYEAKSDE